ncbi:MAG: heme exporter protein B [Myxococcota bacterium]|jgi:heme exporter protein B
MTHLGPIIGQALWLFVRVVVEVIRQAFWVFAKDVLVEIRSPSRFIGVMFFAFAVIFMVAFASNTTDVMRRQAGGVLWIGLLLASTRSLDQSFAAELEHNALEGQTLWPVHPTAIFFGKALANAVILIIVGTILTPLSIAMFDVTVRGSWLQMAGFIVLGSTALAAPGTLFTAITSQARGSSVLLPLLMFPLVVPVLMAAARGTTLIFLPDPMDQSTAWLIALVAFNVIHWPLAGLLFGRVVEGGTH